MKNWLLSFVLFGAVAMTPDAFSRPVHAACAGGPRAPSYAFDSWASARYCAQKIAAFSNQCAAMVRTGPCRAEHYNVDAVNPNWCQCNPNLPAVGYWENR
jgi:hypothetical protein